MNLKQFGSVLRGARVRYGRYFVLYTVLAALVALCEVWSTRLTGSISQAAVESDTASITGFLLTMAAITGMRLLLEPLSVWLGKRFAARVGYGLRREYARHYTSVPYAEVGTRGSGEILSLYTNDLPQATALVAVDSLQMIFELASALAGIVFLFLLQPWIALAFFALFPLLTLLQVKISAPIQANALAASEKRAAFNAVVSDSLQNTDTVAAYSLAGRMEERYLARYHEYFEVEMKRINMFTRLISTGIIVSLVPILFSSLACALSVVAGRMDVAGFIAFISIGSMVNGWLTMLSQRMADIRRNTAGAGRILEAMEAPAEEEQRVEKAPALQAAAEEVFAIQNLTFSYDGEKQVLNGLDLHVRRGEKIAIVGESGCGKSTLLKLLLALYSGYGGSIRLYGGELSQIPLAALRRSITYVPQDNYLFAGTVAENVACAVPGEAVQAAAAEQACRRAGIWEFIAGLPRGMDALVEENGENLSGGQRQRLALARAFYKNSGVYLLDEATSALDPATERMVLESFTGALAGQTAIVVAHRLAAVQSCDRVLVMDGGKICETGTMEELLAQDGLFARMYARQEGT